MKKSKKGQTVLNIFFIILCAVVLYPFLMLLAVSFSNEKDIVINGYKLIPEHFDLAAYRYIFKNPESLLNAYGITIVISVLCMVFGTLFMTMIAFTLSSPKMRIKRGLSFYLYFTMLFNGGLVPTYIMNTQYLHINDTLWIYLFPGLISPFYVFMLRTFLAAIPRALSESMEIDGANEFTIFSRLIIPLSKPVIATVALFTFLAKWNDWYTSMLYINNQNLVTLQYLLQKIFKDIQFLSDNQNIGVQIDTSKIPTTTIQMAMAVIAAGPALIVFPFFQKYFVRGITVGSVKG